MANVFPIDVIAPGSLGLNTEASSTLLAPQWATKARNGIINSSGRLAARKGTANVTTNAISGTPQIDVMHQFVNEAGTIEVISTAANKIYKDVDDFTDSGNDITSSSAPTADYWQFVNFNNKVLGFQRGHTPIQRASGDFANASYTGTGPDGNSAVAAFGRVWAADADLQTVRYSVLLDDTDYRTANGGGTIDMSSVWTQGMDEIVALAALGSNLIVFGKNHIVLWADRSGSEIGLDPTELEVVDTIEGTGCIARDSVAVTGEGDLLFLSRHGVQSLGRVIQFKNNPTTTLSKHVRGNMLEAIKQSRAADSALDRVQAAHSPEEGLYIINFPSIDKQFVFDTNHPFQDEQGDVLFPVTDWQIGDSVAAMVSLTSGELYFGSSSGTVLRYQGQDDVSASYDFEFLTGFLDFGDPQINHRLKMLKEIVASIQVGDATVIWNWEFDFNATTLTRAISYSGGASAEFNVAEFSDGGGSGVGYVNPSVGSGSGETEFSGSAVIQRKNIAAHGEGQFLRVGCTASINGSELAVQHLSIAPKIGRMVT
jgi:hypothetical protein